MRTDIFWNRVSAATGIAAALLIMTGIVISDINGEVSVTASSSRIASTMIANQSTILTGSYFVLIGVFFFIIFLGYLRAFLLATSPNRPWLVYVAHGGGLIACAMLLLAAHFSQAFTVLESYGGETQVAKALYVLEWNWYLLVEAPPLAALVGATALVGFAQKALPWWLSAWGALLTIALLAPTLPGIGILLTFLWVIALSSVLLIEKDVMGAKSSSEKS